MSVVRWGNLPVPFTAMWTGETPMTSFVVRRVPQLMNAPFLFEGTNTPGLGKPMFSWFHTGRAADVLCRRVCQICLAPFAGAAMYCIGTAGSTINAMPHITDGLPMCPGCTRLSIEHCPALGRQLQASILRIYLAKSYILAPAILRPVDVSAGGNPAINAAIRSWSGVVYGTPKIALDAFEVVDLAHIERVTS